MENAMLISLSQQMAMRRAMDITASNLANVSTTSYKSESALFKEYLEPVEQQGTEKETLNFVIDHGLKRNFSEGLITPTGNKMDFAISGDGFFVVETPDGQRYTRNGQFKLNAEFELVTQDGYRVLNADDQPIKIDPADPVLTIAKDGKVQLGENQDGGIIKVVNFANKGNLEKIGSSLYKTEDEAQPVEEFKIVQGALEGSNVSAVQEMTQMIQIMRSYQSAVRTEKSTNEIAKRAIERLGRVQA